MLYSTLQDIPLEIFKKIVNESYSRTDFFKKLDMLPRGAKFKTFNKIVKKHNIDVSHFKSLGQINKERLEFSKEDVLTKMLIPDTHNKQIKKYILKFDIIPYICGICNCTSTWNNLPLTLQLDHINGNPTDNRLDNLRFLCPNCHSQTLTFSGRNKPKSKPPICPLCQSPVHRKDRHCIKCSHIFSLKIDWPNDADLSKLVWTKPLIKLGLELGVSDNAIRKRCKKLQIPLPPRGFWKKDGSLGRG
jgi:hypothetical protein